MNRHLIIKVFFVSLAAAALACEIPPEIINAVANLPTPTPSATPVPSEILYVDKLGNDANDCLTTGTACLTIMAALGKAADGAAIHIGPGTYAEINTAGEGALFIRQNVSLYGVATTGEYTTILSGNGTRDAVTIAGDSQVVLENVAIADAGGRGVGLYATGGAGQHVTLRNAAIRNSAAVAVYILDAAVVDFDNVRINNNPHGAISSHGTFTLRNSRVRNNGSLDTSWGLGGGVIHNSGILRFSDSTVSGNTSADFNAINNYSGGTMTFERSTVSGQSVGRFSTLYNNLESTMTLSNSTVSGNSGTAITSLGDLTLYYSTIAANGRSGLYANDNAADPMHLQVDNSLIENNGAQDCLYEFGNHIVLNTHGQFLSDGSCTNVDSGVFTRPPEGDRFLGPLADNGGPTQTHALLAGSRAIDTAVTPCPAIDQRGTGRPVGGGCDVGAYEYNFALTAATPGDTPIPIWTPTPTGTVPFLVTLIENANCRKGPTTFYDLEIVVSKGDQVLATGRTQAADWLQVESPKSKNHCWISAGLLDVPFDPKLIPVAAFPSLPGAPGPLTAKSACDPKMKEFPVDLSWSEPGGETGFRLYRNGELIATLGAGVTSYSDTAPTGTALNYEVEAFNAAGRSPRAKLSVPACA